MTASLVIITLRYTLILQSLAGVILCFYGIRTAVLDLRAVLEAGVNGGKRVANIMRLQMEGLLLLVFALTLVLGVYFVTPIELIDPVIWARVIAARCIYNVSVGALLLMKACAHRGRQRLDAYYDAAEKTQRRRATDLVAR